MRTIAHRLPIVVLFTWLLTGCVTMQISEKNFIRPDTEAERAQPVQQLDVAALQLRFPDATISRESLSTADGATLNGLTLNQPAAKTTVLYFGGNRFHIDPNAIRVFQVFGACQVNVTVFDYRGYGRSTGMPDIANMQTDALQIYDLLNARAPGTVIAHGQSLGSFIAAFVAQNRPARGVVLESTTTNVSDWAKANTPWYAKPFVRYQFSMPLQGIDNVNALKNFQGHALLLTGENDQITPPRYAREVFAGIASANKKILLVPGAGHNDALAKVASTPELCAFIRSVQN